jgi:DNA-binding MarR family transcriptional regulator
MRSLDVKNLEVENPPVTPATRSRVEPDPVDVNLEVWARELPDLDLETEGIVERIYKLERHIDVTMRETLEAFELSYGEYKLAMHLRYGGPPYRGKPGKLAKWLGLSTGAMTNRLDNMERRGLIRRLDDPDDRRGVIVELTDEKESIITSALDERERRQLNDLLRRLMNAFAEHHGPLKHKTDSQAGE